MSGAVTPARPGRFFADVRLLVVARGAMILLQAASLPILARLLSVEDFAIVALGMAVPLFANAFSDAGMGRSLIRTGGFNAEEWSSVFWFLAALGLALALVVAAIAPLYARAMGQPQLVAVMLLLATVPLMQSAMSTQQAALERAGRFRPVAAIGVAAGLAGVATALGLALAGFGYWALVWQQVVLAGVKLGGFALLSGFRPQWVLRWPLLRPHLLFGRNTLLFSGVQTLQTQVPVLALGAGPGAAAVSLWSMAERVARLPRMGLAGPLSQVAMVTMARQWHGEEGPAGVSRSWRAASRVLATLLLPGFAVLALNGVPVFTVLLSEPWGAAAPLFALAAPAFAIEALASLGARVFMVADRTGLRLQSAIERLVIGGGLFLLALPLGLGLAIALRSAFALAYLPRYWGFLGRCVPLTNWQAAEPLLGPALCGLGVGLLLRVAVLPGIGSAVAATAVVVLGGAAAVALCAALNRRALKSDIAWLQKPRAAH
ncbi:oligosaccharide flippase family protein [Limimaricola pyoseonensis]|uniref:Membrane protein involved in the export of O-antigen and teichoic acid n=1 Tax=Limimaricola pyoseonensis TaxID=521013 RepID=A0A1G7J212_9RHOB|nr:oligosaccharide flippase family protein [Limimaricola pyoseonensis]SDF18834.1 Membrane protein involved in the export of O-antigen and teichoic acid [Limimaricola pyoseonensis]